LLAVSMGVVISIALVLAWRGVVPAAVRCGTERTLGDLVVIDDALEAWRRDHGRWPDDLEALVTPDEQGRTYLHVPAVPRDAWGRPYRLLATGEGPLVFTLGADGAARGDVTYGDRANWWRVADRDGDRGEDRELARTEARSASGGRAERRPSSRDF
jgi:type II secretory pathway pseudopilin PulG